MPARKLSSFPPLSREPLIGPGALAYEPECAGLIAKCIAQWSATEAVLSRVLIDLLGADAKVGLAMFNRLRSSQAQSDALEGAASVAFPQEYRDIWSAVMLAVSKARRKRNLLAHTVWVRSPHIGGALISLNPADLLEIDIKVLEYFRRAESSPIPLSIPKLDYSRIEVYFKDDLIELLREFSSAQGCCYFLSKFMTEDKSLLPEVSMSLRKMPEIQAILAKKDQLLEAPFSALVPPQLSTDVY